LIDIVRRQSRGSNSLVENFFLHRKRDPFFRRIWIGPQTARNMRRKPNPLAPKMKLTPANGSRSAESSGPIIPETSICNPARVYAETNSSCEAISAMTEECAGEPKA